RRAGQVAPVLPEVPEPAPPETTSLCSPAAADLVGNLLDLQSQSGEAELLGVALDRMRRAGQHLPPEVLPAFLESTHLPAGPALAGVVGERGRWLGQLNPEWSWVSEAAEEASGAVPGDADAAWQEGASTRRVRVLRLVRASDPARAREWVQAAWRQEKA